MKKVFLFALIVGVCLFAFRIPAGDLELPTFDTVLDLSGNWKFYPHDDLSFARMDYGDQHWGKIRVPIPWGRQGYPAYSGIAWYRLEVRVDGKTTDENPQLGIAIGKVADSYELYVNGELLGGAGSLPPHPRLDYDRERTYPIPSRLLSRENRLLIALRVWKASETNPLDGGPFEGRFLIGPSERLSRLKVLYEIPALVLFVLFAVVGLYHLQLYRRRRELKECLWFGLLALDMAAYCLLRSQWKYELTDQFILLKDLEYFFLYLMPVLFIQFLWPLLSKPIGRLLRTFQALDLLLVLAIILSPGVALNVRSLYWWEVSVLPVIAGALYLILKEAWRGHPEARTLALGVFSVLIAGLNDIAVDRSLITTPRLISFGFAAFVFSMVISLSNRFVRIFSELDNLSRDLEQRVQKRTRELAEANNRLNELDQIKTRFFANISHEFRTPLTLAIGPIENALSGARGMLTHELRKDLEMMLRNCRRLLRLINQLLDISKIESGRMELRARRLNVVKFVKEISSLFASLAERKNILLSLHCEKEEIELHFDPEKMEKICYNLLSNAFKFTGSSGKIWIGITENESVRIAFKDTGQGIPKEDLPFVFDRFHHVDGASTREQEGTGIGLSLIKDLVELHHGSIIVTSQPGWGSEFIVALPKGSEHLQPHELSEIKDSEEEYTMLHGAETNVSPVQFIDSAQTSGDSIQQTPDHRELLLIVDDNQDVRDYVKGCLKESYRVEQAVDGEEALRKATTFQPDLIISDVMMPKMDGYELCRALRADARLNHIPVVLLTAKASEDMKVEGLEAGADDYLSKPFNAKELTARVRNLIRLRKQEKQLKNFNEELERKVKEQVTALLKSRRLARYLPSNLVERIISSEFEELVSERRNVTIFFTDLAEFSDLTDRTEPERITEILNGYFTEMDLLIVKYGGTLGRFMGDGILGFFGAPDKMDMKLQAKNAVCMAVAMQKKVKELSNGWLEAGVDHDLKIRIGIHQDYVTVGNFGSADHSEYTIIGKGANLAKRLESSCSPGRIHVSFPVYSLTKEEFAYGPLQEREFKGFARTIRTCELEPDEIPLVG